MRRLVIAGVLVLGLVAAPATAQDYPTEEVVAPWGEGGEGGTMEILISDIDGLVGLRDADFCRFMASVLSVDPTEQQISGCVSVLGVSEGQAWLPESMLRIVAGPLEPVSDLANVSFPDLRERAKRPSYKAMLRNPDDYLGELIYLKGEVLQAQDDEEGGQFALISVTKGRYGIWDDNVAVSYSGKPRIIPDDVVEFVMVGAGNYGYESAGAGYLTIPSGAIVKLRIVE